MKMNMNKKVVVLILILVVATILYKSPAKQQEYTIYGSEKCPWTVKALDHAKKMGHSFKYVDCKSEKCPAFVKGFPTYKNHASGNTKSGFTETPHSI